MSIYVLFYIRLSIIIDINRNMSYESIKKIDGK